MRVAIEGFDLPGISCGPYERVHVGVQRKREVVEVHPADASEVRWEFDVELRRNEEGAPDFRGPFVQGVPGERFVYLSWGSVNAAGEFAMFRRIKLRFGDIDPQALRAAEEADGRLVARLGLTGKDGTPLCATVRPPIVEWTSQ